MPLVVFHPAARREYLDALAWYTERGVHLGQQFAQEMAAAVQRIAEAPERWPSGEGLTRRVVVPRFPYLIHYRYAAQAQRVRIVAVAHSSREPTYWHRRS